MPLLGCRQRKKACTQPRFVGGGISPKLAPFLFLPQRPQAIFVLSTIIFFALGFVLLSNERALLGQIRVTTAQYLDTVRLFVALGGNSVGVFAQRTANRG